MRIHVDGTERSLELVDDLDLIRILKNLKRMRHVVGARHARPIARNFRIAEVKTTRIVCDFGVHPVVEVLLLLRQRLGTIRKLAAFDDTLAARL